MFRFGGRYPRLPTPYQGRRTLDTANQPSWFRLRGFHSLGRGFSAAFGSPSETVRRSATPHPPALVAQAFGLTFAAFSHPYLPHRNCFLFLPLLRRFNFGRSLSESGFPDPEYNEDVPLGYPWFYDRMRLPTAYRSLPRPSSPLSSQAILQTAWN